MTIPVEDREQLVKTALIGYERYEAGDLEGSTEFVTDDFVLTFGNNEPVVGKAAYLEGLHHFHGYMTSLRHDVKKVFWSEDGTEMGWSMNVHYVLLDGREIDIPGFSTYQFRDGLVASFQVHIDITPVFGGAYDNAFLEPAK